MKQNVQEIARQLLHDADASDMGRKPDPTDTRRLAATALLRQDTVDQAPKHSGRHQEHNYDCVWTIFKDRLKSRN